MDKILLVSYIVSAVTLFSLLILFIVSYRTNNDITWGSVVRYIYFNYVNYGV